VLWNTVLMAVSWPVGVATSVVIGRWLGPAGKGDYTLAMLISPALFAVLNLGLPGSISYYLAGAKAPENALVKTFLALAGLLGAAALAVAIALHQTGWCLYVFGVPKFTPAMWIGAFGLPFYFAGTFLQFVSLAQGRQVWFAALPAAGQLGVGGAIGVLVWSGRLTSATAAGVMVASYVVTAATLVSQQRRLAWWRAPWTGLALWKSLVRYTALTYLGNTVQFLVQRLDVLLLSALSGLREVGLYSVAYGTAELLLLLPQRFSNLYLARIAASHPMSKAEEVRLLSSLVFLMTLVGAAALAVLAPFGVRLLYGTAFAGSVRPLWFLLPGICAAATASIQAAYLAGLGGVKTTAQINCAGLALNAFLNLILIPRYGISGAAVAASLTYAAQAALLSRTVGRLTQTRPLAMLTSASPALLSAVLKSAFR